jgi:hypothetical protein
MSSHCSTHSLLHSDFIDFARGQSPDMAKRKRDSSALPATPLSSSSSSVVRKADGVAGGPSTPTAAKVEGKSKKAKGKQKATDDHHDVTVGEPAERERKAQVVYVLGHGSEDYKSTISELPKIAGTVLVLSRRVTRYAVVCDILWWGLNTPRASH